MSVQASKREKGMGERSSEMLGSPERGFHVPGEKKKKRKIQIGSLRVYMTHLISDDKNVCFGTNECVSICKCIFV